MVPVHGFSRAARMAAAAMLIVALLAGAACGSDDDPGASVADDPSQTGQELVQEYMSLLEAQDVEGLDELLSDAFLRQGAEGRFATKGDYLDDPPKISGYTISDVTARQDGDALVVRWLFRVDETVGGTRLKSTPSPRLATFIWRDGDWRLLSHANFNPPEEG